MLGIGSSLSSHDVITLIPVPGNPVLQAIFIWMSKIGSFAFSFLPVMFCIAIPLGLARENKRRSGIRWLRRLCGNEPRGKLLVDQ